MPRISMPRRFEVHDYHEFPAAQQIARMIDSSIKVKEIALNPVTGKYLGVMYRGKLTSPKTKKLIRELKQESKQAFDDIVGY